MLRTSRIAVTSAGLLAALAAVVGGPASPDARVARVAMRTCDEIASPAASAASHRHRPYGHRPYGHRPRPPVAQLLASLRPGQTGCLRAGTYVEDVTVSRSRVTLRSYPGERARIVGRLWIRGRAHDVLFKGLALDGRNDAHLPSPTVNGDRVTFDGVDITNRHTDICLLIGSPRYGRADGTVIRRSRIHACGRLPARNTEHGIYVADADDTRIVGNLIYDNADRGVQLYPDAQRTLVEGNVIDGNGEGVIFSGGDGVSSNGNVVQHNVISNSRIRADVESWYPPDSPIGVGNVVRENCLFGGAGGTISPYAGGFTAAANIVADPGYVNPAAGDYRLRAGSPCIRILTGLPSWLRAAAVAPRRS